MRFFKALILLCAAIGAMWTDPKHSCAQDAFPTVNFPTIDPLTPAEVRPASHAEPTTLPSEVGQSDPPIYACACGCGIFEVGTESMLPMGAGLTLYVEYAYQDQNIDWSGVKPASASLNGDKEIRTNFVTPGLQYMFDRSWGIQGELPVDNRYFQTTGGATGNDIVTANWTTIGDLRLQGIYDGFFPDQSLGVLFGAKFPTGSFDYNDYPFDDVDRDSEIGTGSTDVLLGGFYRNNLTLDGTLGWFAQANVDVPVLVQDTYRPGVEADGALGVYLNGLRLGNLGITPIAQVLDGLRGHDSGNQAASPVASGYERVLLSPGLELDLHPVMVYADVEFPVYAHVTGYQLVAADLFKIIVSYHF